MRKFRITKLLAIMALFLVAPMMAFPPAAHAVATLWLSGDGGSTWTSIADGDGNDKNAALGAVTFIGSLGSWSVNVSTGISKPILGSPSSPLMDLNDVSVSTSGPGTLMIRFSDNGFSLSGNNLAVMGIGGTTAGTLSYNAYFDDTNTLFGTTGVIGSLVGFGPGSFHGDALSNILTGNLFSLTQEIIITHGAGVSASSFDATLAVVPLPASALLMGTGLLGLVGLGWRRRKS